MSPKKVDRAAKRLTILEAAIKVFARQGYAATRVEDVADEAGVAKGSVYLYFSSREELLVAAFDALAERSAVILDEVRQPGSVLERLSTVVHSVINMLAADPALARVLLDLWSTRRDTTPPIDMASTYQAYRAAITELLQDGIAQGVVRTDVTDQHAAVVIAAIEGCLVQWLVDPSFPLEALADPVMDVLLRGLRSGDGPRDGTAA